MDPAGERPAEVARIVSLFGLALGLLVAVAVVGMFGLGFGFFAVAIGSALLFLFAAART
jgi:hypothetical protein